MWMTGKLARHYASFPLNGKPEGHELILLDRLVSDLQLPLRPLLTDNGFPTTESFGARNMQELRRGPEIFYK